MRITGFDIERFGTLRDRSVRGLPRGLTVIHGPNEAGKSTLLEFLRGVLFGWSDRRATASGTGARDDSWGGRVHCAADDGSTIGGIL